MAGFLEPEIRHSIYSPPNFFIILFSSTELFGEIVLRLSSVLFISRLFVAETISSISLFVGSTKSIMSA